jgi:hypothetical protein
MLQNEANLDKVGFWPEKKIGLKSSAILLRFKKY